MGAASGGNRAICLGCLPRQSRGVRVGNGRRSRSRELRRKVNPDRVIVRDFTRAEAVRTFSFWAFNLGTAWQAFVITAYTFHVVAIGEESGMTKTAVLALFLPMAGVGVFTNFFSGWLGDRTRAKYVLMLLTGGLTVAGLGMAWLAEPVGRLLADPRIGRLGWGVSDHHRTGLAPLLRADAPGRDQWAQHVDHRARQCARTLRVQSVQRIWRQLPPWLLDRDNLSGVALCRGMVRRKSAAKTRPRADHPKISESSFRAPRNFC